MTDFPVLIGIGQTMAVLRAAMAHRDHRALPPMKPPRAAGGRATAVDGAAAAGHGAG